MIGRFEVHNNATANLYFAAPIKSLSSYARIMPLHDGVIGERGEEPRLRIAGQFCQCRQIQMVVMVVRYQNSIDRRQI